MKKKMLAFILTGILLLLCGCGQASKVQEAIGALGDVTPESGEAIGQIQQMLDEMSVKQRGKVENLQEFKEKKVAFEQMCVLINDVDRTVSAIGTVTPDSGEKIDAARKAYDALKEEGLEKYAEKEYPILEKAEEKYGFMTGLINEAKNTVKAVGDKPGLDSREAIKKAKEAVNAAVEADLKQYVEAEIKAVDRLETEFQELEANYFYDTAISCFKDGDYKNGNEYLTKLKTSYSSHEKAQNIEKEAVKILMGLADKAMADKSYKTVDDYLKFCNLNYSKSSQSNETYKTLRANLDKTLEGQRPYNGKIFHNSIGGGWGKLKITAGSKYDSLIRITSKENPDEYMIFYVRKGESAQVSIKDGTYHVKYSSGNLWYSDKDAFGWDLSDYHTLWNGLNNFITLDTSYSGSYVYYSVFSAEITD